MENVNPQEYPIVSLVDLTFLSSKKHVLGEGHNFMKHFMHLPNLCVNQFLLYDDNRN